MTFARFLHATNQEHAKTKTKRGKGSGVPNGEEERKEGEEEGRKRRRTRGQEMRQHAAKWVAAEQEGRQGGEGKKGEKMAAG